MSYKIIDLPALGRSFNATDIIEVSADGTGSYKANIGNFTLGGENYIFVNANGTPAENGQAVRDAYTAAQAMTPNGAAKSATNRVVILLAPGYYTFNEAVDGALTVNTSFIDLESLSGVPDVYFSSMQVLSTGDGINVRMSGIDTTRNSYYVHGAFAVAASAGVNESLYIRNCVGGEYSFGSYSISINGTFDLCIAGAYSFGYTANSAPIGIVATSTSGTNLYGTFKNCIAGNYSFLSTVATMFSNVANFGTIDNCIAGNYSFCYSVRGSFNAGTIKNCTAGTYSFCSGNELISGTCNSTNSGIINNCTSGINSFVSVIGENINSAQNQGTISNCSASNASFASQSNLLSGVNYGTIINCNAIGGARCFMGEVGQNNGLVSECTTGSSAFCCNAPTEIYSDILRCTMTGDTFTVGSTSGGRVVLGIDTTGVVNY